MASFVAGKVFQRLQKPAVSYDESETFSDVSHYIVLDILRDLHVGCAILEKCDL